MTHSLGLSLLILELGLTLAVLLVALQFPGIGANFFARTEQVLYRISRRPLLSPIICAVLPCLLRLLALPLNRIPLPWIQDEFSFLLAADTFASGRLTNPTPPLWPFFESFQITLKPTYMSMYFPAQGALLAAAKLLTGQPWYGVWLSCGIMCALLCWGLRGWLPPGWAFLGGILVGLRIGVFSYWMDSYSGGAVAAIGGILVLGALPRLCRSFRARDALLMATGMAVLANSRPYEGLLVCVPAALTLGWQLRKRRPVPWKAVLRRSASALCLLAVTVAFVGYYNNRVFGSPFTPAYSVNRATYAVAPVFLFQHAQPEPYYRHAALRNFYARPDTSPEMQWFTTEKGSLAGFLKMNFTKVSGGGLFFFGFLLAMPLVALPWAIRDSSSRIPVILGVVFLSGLSVETWYMHHYAAPALVLIYVLLLQCMRHVRAWGPSGLLLIRAIPVLCAALVVVRLFVPLLGIELPTDPTRSIQTWYGYGDIGSGRARIASELQSKPGPQLAIVRYVPDHVYPEWVYNSAAIEGSKVIWAREMDPASNGKLLEFFNNRTVWLVEPDADPPRISPYPAPNVQLLVSSPNRGTAPAGTLP